MRRVLWLFASGFLTCGISFVFFSSASVAGASSTSSANPSTPTLSIVATNPVLKKTPAGWSTTILVGDAGVCAPNVTYELLVSTTYVSGPIIGTPTVTPTPTSGCALTIGVVNKVTLQFENGFTEMPSAVTLEIFGNTGTSPGAFSPSTIQLSVQRALGLIHEVLFPLLFGILCAGVFIVECTRRIGNNILEAGSSWSFKDSWATNITFVGALLGAIISASGSIASAFPGVPLYRFAMLNAAYASIVGVAPVIAAIGSGPPRINGGQPIITLKRLSVYAAGSLTFLALGGVLVSLGELEWWSSAVLWARVVLIVLTLGVVLPILIYATQSTRELATPRKAHADRTSDARTDTNVQSEPSPRSFKAAAI